MINARAARRFRLAGKLYTKGDPVALPDNQFNDLAGAGLVVRVTRPSRTIVEKIAAATPPPAQAPADEPFVATADEDEVRPQLDDAWFDQADASVGTRLVRPGQSTSAPSATKTRQPRKRRPATKRTD